MSSQSGAEFGSDIVSEIGYTSLTILLFSLFTVVGILTAFLIKHKLRRKAATNERSVKPHIENHQNDEESSPDLVDLDHSNELATLESHSYQAKKQPAERFSRVSLESQENETAEAVKRRLRNNYLQQPSSDEFSFESLGSLKTDDLASPSSDPIECNRLNSTLGNGKTKGLDFREIPKQQPFPDEANSKYDTFSNTYRLSVEEENGLDQLENEIKLEDGRLINREIDDSIHIGHRAKFNGAPTEEANKKELSSNYTKASTSQSTCEVFSSPEDPDPNRFVSGSLPNESEYSSVRSVNWASSASTGRSYQQVRETSSRKANETRKPVGELEKSACSKTPRSVDRPGHSKKPGETQTAVQCAARDRSPPNGRSNSSASRPSQKTTRTSKSVLQVLAKRKGAL